MTEIDTTKPYAVIIRRKKNYYTIRIKDDARHYYEWHAFAHGRKWAEVKARWILQRYIKKNSWQEEEWRLQ